MFGSAIVQKKENNTGLPTQLKSGIESLSGYDMSDVKVHRNSSKPAQLNAHAYAQGTDIHLGSGQEKHLPHEAWHVVQQKQGRVKATMQMKGNTPVNDDVGLEREADVMGAKALQMKASDNTDFIEQTPNGIVQKWSIAGAWDSIKDTASSGLEKVKSVGSSVKEGVTIGANALKDTAVATFEHGKDYVGAVGESVSDDLDKFQANRQKTYSHDQSKYSTGFQQVGNDVMFGLDVVGSLFNNKKTQEVASKAQEMVSDLGGAIHSTKAYKFVTQQIDTLSNKIIKLKNKATESVNKYLEDNPRVNKIVQTVSSELNKAGDTIGQVVSQGINLGKNTVSSFKETYPEVTRNIKAFGEILMIIPIAKVVKVGKSILRGKKGKAKDAEKERKDEERERTHALNSKLNDTVKNDAKKRIDDVYGNLPRYKSDKELEDSGLKGKKFEQAKKELKQWRIKKNQLIKRDVASSRAMDKNGNIGAEYVNIHQKTGTIKGSHIDKDPKTKKTTDRLIIDDIDEYMYNIKDLYKDSGNILHEKIAKSIRLYIKNNSGNLSTFDGNPGLHAEVQAVNAQLHKNTKLEDISVATYKLAPTDHKKNSIQGGKFPACSNCAGIIKSLKVKIITD
jgi:hypothetical protein